MHTIVISWSGSSFMLNVYEYEYSNACVKILCSNLSHVTLLAVLCSGFREIVANFPHAVLLQDNKNKACFVV